MSDRRLGPIAGKLITIGGIVGLAALLVSVFIAMAGGESGGWDRFLRSYLMAFMLVLSICLGALFFTILQHAVKAGWSVAIRRLAEGVAGNLMWIWILFLPILLTVMIDSERAAQLYHWMHPVHDGHADEVLVAKSPYFFFTKPISVDASGHVIQTTHMPWFWIVRAVFFLGLWALLARFYTRNSLAQDSTGDPSLTRRMERFAPVAIGAYFLSQAFASMDWVMSLSPHWFSTMFPVYFFAASCCGYFSVQILMMYFTQRAGRLTREITTEHYQDAGKLLFAFGIVFWAYIAYSQYMLIWYANLPEETPWYLARQSGGWGPVILLLLFGHFVGPFLILISKHPKRAKGTLAAAAGWMLFMHFIDMYWLVMPKVPLELLHQVTSTSEFLQRVTNAQLGYGWHLLDFTCLVGMFGLLVAGTAWRLSGGALIPERDPRLHESLAFENM